MSVRDFTQGILNRAQDKILGMKPGVLNKAARAAYYGLLVPPVLVARGAAFAAPVAGAAAVFMIEVADARVRARCCHCCDCHYGCDCDCDCGCAVVIVR